MVQTELYSWQQEIECFLQDARGELQQIIAAIESLVDSSSPAMSAPVTPTPGRCSPASLQPSLAEIPSVARDTDLRPLHESAEHQTTSQHLNDFSQRLDQLKRQLNQRLQVSPQASSDSNTDSFPETH